MPKAAAEASMVAVSTAALVSGRRLWFSRWGLWFSRWRLWLSGRRFWLPGSWLGLGSRLGLVGLGLAGRVVGSRLGLGSWLGLGFRLGLGAGLGLGLALGLPSLPAPQYPNNRSQNRRQHYGRSVEIAFPSEEKAEEVLWLVGWLYHCEEEGSAHLGCLPAAANTGTLRPSFWRSDLGQPETRNSGQSGGTSVQPSSSRANSRP